MDTLTYFDKLIEGGVVPEQARVQAHTLNDALSNLSGRMDGLNNRIGGLATKDDLKDVKDDLRTIKWSLLVGIFLLCAKAAFHL
jgi:hypothetical protein